MSNYKKIQGFDYAVDCNGNIKSLKTNKNLSLVTNNKRKPYKRVGLTKNGKRYFFLVHRLVAEAFILNPNNEYLLILPINPFRCPCFGIGMIKNE